MQSLHPEGTIKVYLRSWRNAPEQPVHQHLIVDAKGCSIQYEKFPYPLRNIRGTLEMYDGSWTFRDLEGYNNTGRVRGEGHLAPTLQGNELFLRLVGNDVALDEQLRDALRHNQRQVWQVLRPRGAMDLVAEIRYLCEPKQLSVSVDAQTDPENTSIEPVHFPYRLEKLDSALHYRDGRVTIAHLKAEHGPVKLATGGYCEFPPGGRWHLHLEGLAADRVRFDRELMQALPEQLKKSLAALKPGGAINVRGSFDLEPGEYLADPARSAWDVRLGLNQASLDCGVKIENVHGTVHLVGSSDGKRFQSRGELALDSLHYKDYQFTQVMGPLWIDERQVLLGSWVARRLSETPGGGVQRGQEKPRPVTARIFGGVFEGDGWVALGDEPRYGLRGTLAGADLARCAAEVMPGQQRLRGKIAAAVELTGSGRSTNSLSGRGTIRLRDADVYELPVMISLLKPVEHPCARPERLQHQRHRVPHRRRTPVLRPHRLQRRRHQPAGQGRNGLPAGDPHDLPRRGRPRRPEPARAQGGLQRREQTDPADPRGRHVAEPGNEEGGVPRRQPGAAATRRRSAAAGIAAGAAAAERQ